MRGIRVAAERRANAVEFVSGNRRTNTTTADQYPNLRGATLHSFADLFRVIRIIVRNRTVVRAEIDQIVAGMTQFIDHSFIERIPTMICSDCNSHPVNLENPVILSNFGSMPLRVGERYQH